MTTLGGNIKYLRRMHNMSQEDLARKIGKCKQAVSNCERLKTLDKSGTLKSICNLFGYSSEQLRSETCFVPAKIKKIENISERCFYVESTLIELKYCIPTKNRFVSPF